MKETVEHTARVWWHFTWPTFLAASLSVNIKQYRYFPLTLVQIIPIVGSFGSFLAQNYFTAQSLGWNVLSVHTLDEQQMEYSEQKNWMNSHKWTILGWATLSLNATKIIQLWHIFYIAFLSSICWSSVFGNGTSIECTFVLPDSCCRTKRKETTIDITVHNYNKLNMNWDIVTVKM